MNITLYRDLPSEHWPSMERYADELVRHLPSTSPALRVTSFVAPLPFSMRGVLNSHWTQAWRSAVYPLTARFHQGDINHIVDHSYAHLVHFLDAHKTVVTCHDLAPLALRDMHAAHGLSVRLWDWAFSGLLKAAHIICDSKFTAHELARLSEYPITRTSIVPLGVNPAFRPMADETVLTELRLRYHLPTERPIILHVGHCGARKNLDHLLEALGIAQRNRVPFHFVQIGGEFTPTQRIVIRSHQLATRITQLRLVPDDELPAWYNLADLFVFPSTYEGFGLPVLEAMACGTPVICGNAGSLPEVGGDAVRYTDPLQSLSIAQAITDVLNSTAAQTEMTDAGLARASIFAWQDTARRVADVYRKFLA